MADAELSDEEEAELDELSEREQLGTSKPNISASSTMRQITPMASGTAKLGSLLINDSFPLVRDFVARCCSECAGARLPACDA